MLGLYGRALPQEDVAAELTDDVPLVKLADVRGLVVSLAQVKVEVSLSHSVVHCESVIK